MLRKLEDTSTSLEYFESAEKSKLSLALCAFFFLFRFSFWFFETGFLFGACPGTSSVDQAGLELMPNMLNSEYVLGYLTHVSFVAMIIS